MKSVEPFTHTSMDYQLSPDRGRLVDAAFSVHHRRIRRLFDQSVRKYDVPRNWVLEIGPGFKSRRRRISAARTVVVDREPRSGTDVRTDVAHLPFRDGAFDFVICENVLEHIAEPNDAVREVSRVTRPGGGVFLVTPFLFPIHDPPFDFFRYTEYSLRNLLSSFHSIHIESIPLVPLPAHVRERFPLYYVAIAQR